MSNPNGLTNWPTRTDNAIGGVVLDEGVVDDLEGRCRSGAGWYCSSNPRPTFGDSRPDQRVSMRVSTKLVGASSTVASVDRQRLEARLNEELGRERPTRGRARPRRGRGARSARGRTRQRRRPRLGRSRLERPRLPRAVPSPPATQRPARRSSAAAPAPAPGPRSSRWSSAAIRASRSWACAVALSSRTALALTATSARPMRRGWRPAHASSRHDLACRWPCLS